MQNPKKTEIEKQRKREIDRRHRQKKKSAMMETENKLATTMIENENLKSTVEKLQQEIIQLTKQLNSNERRPDTTCGEIDLPRIENEVAKGLLKEHDSYISDMVKVLKENEEMKRTIEDCKALIAEVTEKLKK